MLSDAAFSKLLARIRGLLSEAQGHRSVDSQLVYTYWNVGQLISKSGATDTAAYGDALVRRLAKELEIHSRTLYQSIRFFDTYKQPPETELTWAHYRELLKLSDSAERAFYERLAIDEQLSRDRLVLAIGSDVYAKHDGAKGAVKLSRPSEPRYLFDATLVRVVDGDTLLFDIDVGFELVKRQRVRLSAINTFSADSKKGQQATEYVLRRLTVADRIVLQTRRADLHGRYLAHVFYSTRKLDFLETFTAGHYLNQQLLDRKLAMRMR